MDLKNAARKLWHSDVEEDQVYSGPYLVKGGHMDYFGALSAFNSATYASMLYSLMERCDTDGIFRCC